MLAFLDWLGVDPFTTHPLDVQLVIGLLLGLQLVGFLPLGLQPPSGRWSSGRGLLARWSSGRGSLARSSSGAEVVKR